MQNPTTPVQTYQKAIDLLENVRLETQLKGRDGDVHRAAVQAVVALFNEWTLQAKEITDLKSRIEQQAKIIEAASKTASEVTPGGPDQ